MNILLVGSNITAKGGISSVIQNYLSYSNWKNSNIFFLPTHIENNILNKIVYFAISLFKLNRIINKREINIAHIHMSDKGSFFRKRIVSKRLKRYGIKIILHHHAHSFNIFYENSSKRVKRKIQDLFEIVDTNVVLSNQIKTELVKYFPKAKFEILYNAVEVYPENPYNIDSNVILFLGHLEKRKGIFDLLIAIKQLHTLLEPSYTFALCGNDYEGVSEIIKQMGLTARVHHIGWISSEHKKSMLSKTILHVLPSYAEAMPMSILETMSYGIPNISTSIASIPEIINDGINGFIIEPGDVDSLCNRILLLLNNKQQRLLFSKNSFSLVNKEFSLLTHIKNLESLYIKVFGK